MPMLHRERRGRRDTHKVGGFLNSYRYDDDCDDDDNYVDKVVVALLKQLNSRIVYTKSNIKVILRFSTVKQIKHIFVNTYYKN